MKNFEWNKKNLWELRQEICLNSLYIDDYENSFGVQARKCCDFFDSYLDFLSELMDDDGYSDNDFFDMLDDYDNGENLWEWYCCYDNEPLPIEESED